MHNSCTAINPNGDAKLACDRLESKYRPSTVPMRLEKTLVNIKLAPSHNHDAWMTYVEQSVCRMNNCTVAGKSAMIDMDIILHILCHLPESYEGLVQELSTKLEQDPTACTPQLLVRE